MHGVLFVCTGNLCRSPLAQGLLEAILAAQGLAAHYRVDSAGTSARAGLAPAPLAVACAAALGADIGAQRSRPVVAADFHAFEDIYALDRGHLDFLLAIRPAGHRGRIRLLPAADGRGAIDVPDPWGRPARAYERAARLIAAALPQVVADLERRRAAATPATLSERGR